MGKNEILRKEILIWAFFGTQTFGLLGSRNPPPPFLKEHSGHPPPPQFCVVKVLRVHRDSNMPPPPPPPPTSPVSGTTAQPQATCNAPRAPLRIACVAQFGPLGWNNKYEFNDTDLSVGTQWLQMFLQENSEIPWEALRYVIGQIVYGGRVTDPWDRRTLLSCLQNFMREELLADGYALSPSGVYAMPHLLTVCAIPCPWEVCTLQEEPPPPPGGSVPSRPTQTLGPVTLTWCEGPTVLRTAPTDRKRGATRHSTDGSTKQGARVHYYQCQ